MSQVEDRHLLKVDGIAKSYVGITVLKDVSFTVSRGKVLALMGENGAGKSTLKNILCGLAAPDTGSLIFEGTRYSKFSNKEALALGIGAIHQELSLFPNISIAENIHMGVGALPTRLGLIENRQMKSRSIELLSDFMERRVDPDQIVGSLSLGERQLVEVAKAIHRASALLIFDEPTTSLSVRERRRLFDVVRRLRDSGYAIIYITHFMEEVYELADDIVVLRDGRVVGTGTPSDTSAEQLASMMAGRELASIDSELAAAQRDCEKSAFARTVLRLSHLSDHTLLKDVSFDLHAGEILGLAGLMGAGRTEVAQAIFGIGKAMGGVEVNGHPFVDRSPETAKAHGIALVSEDRRADQIFAALTVRENLTSAILQTVTSGAGILSRKRQRERAEDLVRHYGVRHPGLDAPMLALSGGNQQKCVIARWLATDPIICILDEPTKGIDVRAKAEIHLLISRLAAKGLGVLLISSDLPELLSLSHRVLVLHKGQIVGRLERAEFDPGRIVGMASMGAAA